MPEYRITFSYRNPTDGKTKVHCDYEITGCVEDAVAEAEKYYGDLPEYQFVAAHVWDGSRWVPADDIRVCN